MREWRGEVYKLERSEGNRVVIGSFDDFMALVGDPDPEVWQSVREMSAATEVWHEILDRAPDEAFTVSLNRTIPEEIVRRLATNEDWRVRHSAIGLRHPSADILAMLAQDEHDAVRSVVANNPRTRIETLETMRDDPWDVIREDVAARLRSEESPGEAPQV